MLSGTVLPMDENAVSAGLRTAKQLDAAADTVPRKGLGGAAAKSKPRRALGDLSSSQVNSRLVEKQTGGKNTLKISAKPESFQVLEVVPEPSASCDYFDEADFLCSGGVSVRPDPADVVLQLSKQTSIRAWPLSRRPVAGTEEAPLFPAVYCDDDTLFDVLGDPGEPSPTPPYIELDSFDAHW